MTDSTEPESRIRSAIREKALATGRPAELDLILCCARSDVDTRVAARIGELLQYEMDWEYVSAMAQRQGVHSLLYNSLRRTHADRVPKAILENWQRAFHTRSARTHVQVEELLGLLEAFSRGGIPALPFKGPVLSAYAYGNPYLRRSGDLDLLIPRSHFVAVRDILVERGYKGRVDPRKEEKYLRGRGGTTYTRETGNVDLHWTLEQRSFDSFPFSYKYDTAHLLERSTTVFVDDTYVPSLSPEDLLIYLSAHGAKHSWSSLYLMCDIAEVIRAHGRAMDWPWIKEQTQRHRTQRILSLSLLLTTSLFGVDLPHAVADLVREDAKVELLAVHVGERLFDFPGAASLEEESWKHHLFRVQLLSEWHKKALYLLYRGLRKLSKIHD